MINKKNNLIISVALLVIAIGALAWYLMPHSPASKATPDYFTLKVLDKNLPEDRVKKFTADFNEAKANLEVNADDFNSWVQLGAAKKQVGDYAGAEAIWIHAGEIRPLNSLSFANLGDLYANYLMDNAKAEAAYFKAVSNSAGEEINAMYYNNFYQFYRYTVKDAVKAENILLEAIGGNPKVASLPATLGYFYQDLGQKDKAIQYFELSLKINPNNKVLKQDLAALKASK